MQGGGDRSSAFPVVCRMAAEGRIRVRTSSVSVVPFVGLQ